MTGDRDLERLLDRWFDEEARPMPEPVLNAVLQAVPRVAGRRARGRFDWPPAAQRALSLVAAGALIVLALVAGPRLVNQIVPASQVPGGVVPSASRSNPFVGTWTSIDVDGSAQSLAITGGAALRLAYEDSSAPGTCAGAPTSIFSSTLTGTLTGDLLSATMDSARCGSKALPDLVGYSLQFTYDPVTDTLNGIGVTWYRSAAAP